MRVGGVDLGRCCGGQPGCSSFRPCGGLFWLDLVLYVLVTFAVVIGVQTIGNILVLALLVTPAATARMLTDRLGMMTVLSPAIGGVGVFIGLYISWSWDFPTGGTVVLVLAAAFLIAWFFAPRQELLAKAIRRARRGSGSRWSFRRWQRPPSQSVWPERQWPAPPLDPSDNGIELPAVIFDVPGWVDYGLWSPCALPARDLPLRI